MWAVPAPPAGARRHPVRGDRAAGDRGAGPDRPGRGPRQRGDLDRLRRPDGVMSFGSPTPVDVAVTGPRPVLRPGVRSVGGSYTAAGRRLGVDWRVVRRRLDRAFLEEMRRPRAADREA